MRARGRYRQVRIFNILITSMRKPPTTTQPDDAKLFGCLKIQPNEWAILDTQTPLN